MSLGLNDDSDWLSRAQAHADLIARQQAIFAAFEAGLKLGRKVAHSLPWLAWLGEAFKKHTAAAKFLEVDKGTLSRALTSCTFPDDFIEARLEPAYQRRCKSDNYPKPSDALIEKCQFMYAASELAKLWNPHLPPLTFEVHACLDALVELVGGQRTPVTPPVLLQLAEQACSQVHRLPAFGEPWEVRNGHALLGHWAEWCAIWKLTNKIKDLSR